jgi:hypothetical protein
LIRTWVKTVAAVSSEVAATGTSTPPGAGPQPVGYPSKPPLTRQITYRHNGRPVRSRALLGGQTDQSTRADGRVGRVEPDNSTTGQVCPVLERELDRQHQGDPGLLAPAGRRARSDRGPDLTTSTRGGMTCPSARR